MKLLTFLFALPCFAVTTCTFPCTNVYQSPYNWTTAAGATTLNIGGGYMKFSVTGTTTISINLNVTGNNGIGNNAMPSMKTVVSTSSIAGAFSLAQATDNNSASQNVSLATGLTSGTTYQVWIGFIGGTQTSNNCWSTSGCATVVNSLQFDNGATVSAYPVIRPNNCVFSGDSYLTSYFGGTASGALYTYIDPFQAWPSMIATAAALNCEFMQMGVGGSGWVITPAGTSGFGTFPTWWNKLNSATTISFSPAPNFVFVPLGVNDHGQNYAAISSAVSGWIPTARSTFGSSASIFIVAPLRDNNATTSTVQTAIQAGIAAASDAHTFYIPMGTEFQNAVFAPSGTITGTPTWISLDDGHPLAQYHGIIASIVTAFTMKILYQQQYQPTHVLLGGIGFPWWMGALLAVWLGFNLIWRATEGRRRRSNNTATERTGR